MKLFWKIFLSMISVITILFAAFGGWLLHVSFRTAIDHELDQSIQQNQMFLYSLEASMELINEADYDNSKIQNIVESIQLSLGQNEYFIRIYSVENEVLYENSRLPNQLSKDSLKEEHYAYQIHVQNDRHYLEIMSELKVFHSPYYINLMKDVQNIYNDRYELSKQYQFILVIALFIATLIAYLLSHSIAKPITSLSQSAQQLADGDYQRRISQKAGGEVGNLIENFNIMAQKLEEDVTQLKDSARKQENFTAAFAHELKTPLTSIVGYSDMVRSMDLDRDSIKEYSNYIFTQGKRLEKLSYSMMDLIALNTQDIAFQTISVENLCESLLPLVSPALSQKHIHFLTDIQPGSIQGEHSLLLSLLNNLIDNARKAVDEDGFILLRGRDLEDTYQFSLLDNGRGIPEDEIDKITEAFYMVDKSRARKEGGAGIGMNLCLRIIQLHQATWTIKSKLEVGTVIYMEFPKIVSRLS